MDTGDGHDRLYGADGDDVLIMVLVMTICMEVMEMML